MELDSTSDTTRRISLIGAHIENCGTPRAYILKIPRNDTTYSRKGVI